jgi:uncharacterized membrane protein HdeD (DUF308 family)
MSTMASEEEFFNPDFGRWWWVLLITGTAWLVLSIVMFRLDITSVKSTGYLAGIIFIVAGVFEFFMVAVVRGGWWKALNVILGIIFVAGGINAIARPVDAFVAIAQITAFLFLFAGIWDLVIAFSDRTGLWWVRMISGFILIGLAFWASGEFGKKATLLLVWVAVFALFRGINSFITAFQLRHVHKGFETVKKDLAPA